MTVSIETDSTATASAIRELRAEVSALRREVRELIDEVQRDRELRQQPRPRALSAPDRRWLSAMLPVVVGLFGADVWTVRDLFEDASPGLLLVLGALRPRQVGRLLRRAEGHAVDGLVVVRDGPLANVIHWRIDRADQ